MKSNNQAYKLPFQTKLVFGFVLLLSVALISKWTYDSFMHDHQPSQNELRLVGIANQVTEVCLREETKSIKASMEVNEDDQEWINFKAPEYCRCVSSRLVSYWEGNSKFDQISKIDNDRISDFIAGQLKGEESKNLVDYCLSKAQKITAKKVTASAQKTN